MKNTVYRVVAVILCIAIPCALYAYFSGIYTAEDTGTDYIMMAGIFIPWIVTVCVLLRVWQKDKQVGWNREKTLRLVISAFMTALAVVLGGLLSIPAMPFGTYSVKIGFGALPVIITGILFGPGYGAMVGGMSDFLQAIIFPKGPYVPFFTVIGILFGLIPGLFFMKKQEPKFLRILLAIAVGQITASVVCNSLLLIWLYNLPWATFIPRMINQAVMIPIYSIITYGAMKLIRGKNILPKV